MGSGRLFIGEQIFDDIFPALPWGLRLRFEYFVNFLDAAFFTLYLKSFFVEVKRNLIVRLMIGSAILFSFATLVLPLSVVRYLREPFQITVALMLPAGLVLAIGT